MVDPGPRPATSPRSRGGRPGPYGFYEALDYTPSRLPEGAGRGDRPRLHGAPPGHDARRAGQRAARRGMRARFHAEPIVQATELLLQERAPRDVAVMRPRAKEVQVHPRARPVLARLLVRRRHLRGWPHPPLRRRRGGRGSNYTVYLRKSGSPVVKLGEGAALSLSADTQWALADSRLRTRRSCCSRRAPGSRGSRGQGRHALPVGRVASRQQERAAGRKRRRARRPALHAVDRRRKAESRDDRRHRHGVSGFRGFSRREARGGDRPGPQGSPVSAGRGRVPADRGPRQRRVSSPLHRGRQVDLRLEAATCRRGSTGSIWRPGTTSSGRSSMPLDPSGVERISNVVVTPEESPTRTRTAGCSRISSSSKA